MHQLISKSTTRPWPAAPLGATPTRCAAARTISAVGASAAAAQNAIKGSTAPSGTPTFRWIACSRVTPWSTLCFVWTSSKYAWHSTTHSISTIMWKVHCLLAEVVYHEQDQWCLHHAPRRRLHCLRQQPELVQMCGTTLRLQCYCGKVTSTTTSAATIKCRPWLF